MSTSDIFKHSFFWFDLETTGLDHREVGMQPLEWALVLADDAPGGTLEPVQSWAGVIQCPKPPPTCDLYVVGMHTKNGLWAECQAATETVASTDDLLFGLAQMISGQDKPRGIELAGNSVHFDLEWCKVHFPKFAACLSHRVMNVSTLLSAGRTWYPDWEELPSANAHRALDDVYASLALARHCRAKMGWGA